MKNYLGHTTQTKISSINAFAFNVPIKRAMLNHGSVVTTVTGARTHVQTGIESVKESHVCYAILTITLRPNTIFVNRIFIVA